MESPALRWIEVHTAHRSYKDTFYCVDKKKKGWNFYCILKSYIDPSSSSTLLSVWHCLFSLSFSSFCLSSRVFHPDQSGILPCLLRSLHHNYGAVGSGEIRDEKIGRVEKSDRWNVGQWRCARGSFSLRFSLLLSLPGPQLKRVKEIGGESASHPHLPLSMQMCRSWGCVIFLKKTLLTDAERRVWR